MQIKLNFSSIFVHCYDECRQCYRAFSIMAQSPQYSQTIIFIAVINNNYYYRYNLKCTGYIDIIATKAAGAQL